jgi:hypothetical protein
MQVLLDLLQEQHIFNWESISLSPTERHTLQGWRRFFRLKAANWLQKKAPLTTITPEIDYVAFLITQMVDFVDDYLYRYPNALALVVASNGEQVSYDPRIAQVVDNILIVNNEYNDFVNDPKYIWTDNARWELRNKVWTRVKYPIWTTKNEY